MKVLPTPINEGFFFHPLLSVCDTSIPWDYNKTIESPGYPDEYYGGQNCRYSFSGNSYSTLRVIFTYFHLPNTSCDTDYIEVGTRITWRNGSSLQRTYDYSLNQRLERNRTCEKQFINTSLFSFVGKRIKQTTMYCCIRDCVVSRKWTTISNEISKYLLL